MTENRKEKKLARALQKQTGWSYTRALYMVREKTAEQIEEAVAARLKQRAENKQYEGIHSDICEIEDAHALEEIEKEVARLEGGDQ